MKIMIRILSLVALAVVAFALPAFAQDAAATPAAQGICTEDARAKMYTDYYNLRKQADAASQKQAHDLGQQYLQKYGSCDDQYTKAVDKFVKAYEGAVEQANLPNFIFGTTPDYQKGFDIGRRNLAANPDDVNTLIILGYGGYQAHTKKNTAYDADALNYAKRAVQLIESGKTPTSWTPFSSKDEALSYLYYEIGDYTLNNDPAGALQAFIKAASIEGPAKKSAATYAKLAAAYQLAQYNKMQQDFNTKFGGKPETDESKYELGQLYQVIDRIIDAYARAVSLAGNDPSMKAFKDDWTTQLTNFYKFRHDNKTDGLDTYIASVASTPLPTPYEPKPYVPPATPATGTTTSGDGASGTKPPTTTPPATTQQPPAKKPPVAKRHHG
jgi:tetratricopeptide (TPR) repeat protein